MSGCVSMSAVCVDLLYLVVCVCGWTCCVCVCVCLHGPARVVRLCLCLCGKRVEKGNVGSGVQRGWGDPCAGPVCYSGFTGLQGGGASSSGLGRMGGGPSLPSPDPEPPVVLDPLGASSPWVGPAFSAWAAATWDSAFPVPFQRPRPPLMTCRRDAAMAPPSPPAPAGPAGASTQVALITKSSCRLADNGAQLATNWPSSASTGRQHSRWGHTVCSLGVADPSSGLAGLCRGSLCCY